MDKHQIFCIFLFLTGACVFGTIISNTNRRDLAKHTHTHTRRFAD